MSERSISRTAVVAVVLVIATASAHAQSKAGLGVSPQAIQAKTNYCKTCHGIEGQGFRSNLNILPTSCRPSSIKGAPTP